MKRTLSLGLATVILALPLVGCDTTESRQKSETTTTAKTPAGTKETPETVARKVESDTQ